MRPSDTSVRGLKLLVYEALSYSVRATLFFLACLSTWRHASPIVTTMKKCQIFFLVRSRELLELVSRELWLLCPHTASYYYTCVLIQVSLRGIPPAVCYKDPCMLSGVLPFFLSSLLPYLCPHTGVLILIYVSLCMFLFFLIFLAKWKNV